MSGLMNFWLTSASKMNTTQNIGRNSTDVITGATIKLVPYGEFFLKAQLATSLILYPLFCTFGFLGNLISIVVMSRKSMRTSTNVFLIALGVTDTTKILNDFLYFILTLWLRVNPVVGSKAFTTVYPYCHYLFNMTPCASAWLTVAVAVERYIFVCLPTKANIYCTIHRAKTVSVLVVMTVCLISLPFAFRYTSSLVHNNMTNVEVIKLDVHSLWHHPTFTKPFIWIHTCLRTAIPVLVLLFLNVSILNGLSKSRAANGNPSVKWKITAMLVFIVFTFLVCVCPDAIMSTVFDLGYYEENYLARGVREITDFLLLFNCSVNFVPYCIFNSHFRKTFLQIFRINAAQEERDLIGAGQEEIGLIGLVETTRDTLKIPRPISVETKLLDLKDNFTSSAQNFNLDNINLNA